MSRQFRSLRRSRARFEPLTPNLRLEPADAPTAVEVPEGGWKPGVSRRGRLGGEDGLRGLRGEPVSRRRLVLTLQESLIDNAKALPGAN